MERQAAAKVPKNSARTSHVRTQSARSPAAAHPLLALQRSVGNQAMQGLINSPYIQAKLQVSTPGDPFEQEADRVADTVMRMPQPAATAEQPPGTIASPQATDITPLVMQRASESPLEAETKEDEAATPPVVQRVPLAVREDDDDEEKIATKPDPHPDAPVEEKEQTVAAKLATDTPLQRQAKVDEEKKEETLQPAPLIQRLCTNCEGDKEREEENTAGAMVQRKSAPESDDDDVEEGQVRRKAGEPATPGVTPSVAANIHAMNGGGSPLPEKTRAFFEPRFGANFSQVRVHTDSRAADTAKAINAKAFTVGRNIAFGNGQYAPESQEGRQLLAHELTHTVQQGGALRTKKQPDAPETGALKTDEHRIQAAWYNFDIPFTDYQFDPSLQGVKNAANIVKDTAAAGVEWIVDEIKSLVSSGIDWLSEKWNSLKEFAASGFEAVKTSFTDILGFIKSPFSFIANAILSFDAQSLLTAWGSFKEFVSGIWKGFKVVTDRLLQQVNEVWEGISGFALSLLSKVTRLTQNFLFKKLPDTLQELAFSLIGRLKSLWQSISDGWIRVFNRIKTWVEGALDTVLQFVLRVTSFAMEVVIEGIRQFGELVLFLKDLFSNPQKYLDILASKSVAAFDGLESRFSEVVGRYFQEDKKTATDTAVTGTIQRQADPGAVPEAKSSATWGEIGTGIWEMMGKKWNEFKSNPLSIVTGLLLDMFIPIYGNVKDVIELFGDIKKIVTGPLSAESLEELWTSFLLILDIPILIYQRVVGILMRSLMLPLIIATFIPHPLVKGIAAAVGYVLLGAFVQAELMNVGQKVLLLKTGRLTNDQKADAYNRIADTFIALAMTVVIVVIMLILHFIANVMKGIYNFVKGKVFPVERAPGKVKGPAEGKGTAGEGKGSKAAEAPKLEGELASRDGQRSVKVTEKGKAWVCASPCQELRLKYEAQIKDNPAFNERLTALEKGYSDLPPKQKSLRDAQIRQLEQELADLKLAKEGGVRAPKEIEWPPKPPQGDKPPITAPNAAEWRYQRYVYEKFLEKAKPKEILPPDEWMRRYFDPTAEGGRPGRPGGPEQVAAKKALAKEGVKIVENVELGGRFPDGFEPKPNPAGGKNYFEVGKMLDSGIPEARERVKIADEIKAMGPNDTVTFVDKSDVTKRVTYGKGSTPENPTSRTFTP